MFLQRLELKHILMDFTCCLLSNPVSLLASCCNPLWDGHLIKYSEAGLCTYIWTRKSSCVNARGILPICVVSTPSVVLTGYPPGRVPPILTWPGGVPYLGGTLAGYPQVDLAGYPPGVCPMEFWVMLQSIMGYGYPPRCLPHGILGNVAKHCGIWVPTQVWTDWKHYLPHLSDVDGKYACTDSSGKYCVAN